MSAVAERPLDAELTDAQFARLPKFAQQHIKALRMERDAAVRLMNKQLDEQTVSSFFIDRLESTGEKQGPSFKRRYVQTNKITVSHAGVELNINIHGQNSIGLQWHGEERALSDIGMVPESYCSVRLMAKENMR